MMTVLPLIGQAKFDSISTITFARKIATHTRDNQILARLPEFYKPSLEGADTRDCVSPNCVIDNSCRKMPFMPLRNRLDMKCVHIYMVHGTPILI